MTNDDLEAIVYPGSQEFAWPSAGVRIMSSVSIGNWKSWKEEGG